MHQDLRAHNLGGLGILIIIRAQRRFDAKPLLDCEAFAALRAIELFKVVSNHGYFIEWPNEADLSADTICLEGVAA